MDPITQGFVDEFCISANLSRLKSSDKFEHFCAHTIVSQHYSSSFSTTDIVVGKDGNDLGLDVIAVIVNGSLVTSADEIDGFINLNGYLDVQFIFIQSETTSGFDGKKILNISKGVIDFFTADDNKQCNTYVKEYIDIKSEIYKSSARFRRTNPKCYIYYVTTGILKDQSDFMNERTLASEQDIDRLNMLESVSFRCIDAREIQTYYRKSINAHTATIHFPKKTPIVQREGIEESYIGVISVQEIFKLIHNKDGNIIKSLFNDNVRHWQDYNDVNSDIRQTIQDIEKRSLFPMLNNGITVVARDIRGTQEDYVLEDYQIVNGCQTCYVISDMMNEIGDDEFFVPIRLIETEKDDIRNDVVKGTNHQTAVKKEDLYALLDFSRDIEEFFKTYSDKYRLYYERRSNQYHKEPGIEKGRIINISTMVRSYASMFLEKPHTSSKNYKTILNDFEKTIINEDNEYLPYYIASYAYYRLEILFRRKKVTSEYRTAKYHMLLAFRNIANSDSRPRLNSKDIVKYCKVIEGILHDDAKCEKAFIEARDLIAIVASEIGNGTIDRDVIRTEPFTRSLLMKLASRGDGNE